MKTTKKRLPEITALVEDVGDLRAFGLVVDLQSVTAAASVLGESKATTSRRLTKLESVLGVSLLVRTSRNITVTEQGRIYRQRIGEVLEMLAHANSNAQAVHQDPHGDLRIAAPSALTRVIASIVATYVDREPGVNVEVLVSDRSIDLDAEEIDAAFDLYSERRGESVDQEILTVPLICVATKQYAKQAHVVVPGDLARAKVITCTSDGHDLAFVDGNSKKSPPVKLQPTITCSNVLLATELAMQGAGIAIVPHLAVAGEAISSRLIRVLPEHSIPWGGLYFRQRRMRNLSPKLSSFRDFVREHVRSFAI